MSRARRMPRGLSASMGDGAASAVGVSAPLSGTAPAIAANMPLMAPRKVSFEETLTSCCDVSSAFLGSKWASASRTAEHCIQQAASNRSLSRLRRRSNSNHESHSDWQSRKRSLHSLSSSKCLSSLAAVDSDEDSAGESDLESLCCKRMASAEWLEEDNWGQFIDVVPAEVNEVRRMPQYSYLPSTPPPSPSFSPYVIHSRSLRSQPYNKRQRQMYIRETKQAKPTAPPHFREFSRDCHDNEIDRLRLHFIRGRSLSADEESLETVSSALFHMRV